MRTPAEDALLRTLAFHRTWGHAPTAAEWISTLEADPTLVRRADAEEAAARLVAGGDVVLHAGRCVFASDGPASVERLRENEIWSARKFRAARDAAEWLARLSSVRFVALCNTAALGHARDESDLDFFVVTRRGTVSATRTISALLFELLGRRPKPGRVRDAVCLSYFVTEDGLDLSGHMLPSDADTSVGIPTSRIQKSECRDPYFRYWFLSLIPLYDDGIGAALWDANRTITSLHPFCRPWTVPPDLRVIQPRVRLPVLPSLESMAARLQSNAFPPAIRDLMNRDTRVMVSPTVLKFHVDDRREKYRRDYSIFCANLGIAV